VVDSASGTDVSGCNCPPRCTNNVHQTTVSSSRLSDAMINYYVREGGENESQIGRSYVDAAEIRSRIASSSLTDIVGHLEKTIRAYKRLKAILEVDLIEHTTSVPAQIQASISTIAQNTHRTLEQFASQIVGKFVDHYEQNVEIIVTQLVKSAKSILSSPYYFYLDRIDLNDPDDWDVLRAASYAETLLDHKDTFCRAGAHLDSVIDITFEANFSARFFLDGSCLDELDSMEYCEESEFENLMSNDTEYHAKLVELISDSAAAAKAVLRCIPMYRTFLTQVDDWLKRALAMNSSQSLQSPDRPLVLNELEHELQWLEKVSSAFAEKSAVRAFLYISYIFNEAVQARWIEWPTPFFKSALDLRCMNRLTVFA